MRSVRFPLAALLLQACALFKGAPPPAGVRIEFAGDEALPRDEAVEIVRPDLERFALGKGGKSDVDDAAYALEQALRERGWPEPSVAYEFHPEEEPPRAVLRVRAGERLQLAEVSAAGDVTLPRAQLRAFFGLGTGLLAVAETPYSSAKAEAAREAVEAHLRAQGRLAAKVAIAGRDTEGGRVSLRLRIDAGPVHTIGTATVVDAAGLPVEQQELDALLASWRGQVAHPRTAVALQSTLEELVASRGWPDARATTLETKTEGAVVSYRFELVPGPRVQVGAVRVEGLQATRASFVRNRLLLASGEPWSRSKELDSAAALWRSGLFARVALDAEPAAQVAGVETRDLVVRLEEIPSLEYSVEPAYGSYEGPMLRLGASERNLFGTGRTLSLQGSLSEKAWSARLALHDPWTFGEDTEAQVALYSERREEPSFERGELGLSTTFTRRLSPSWSASLGWELRASKLFESDVDADPDAVAGADTLDISEFVLLVSRDTRDNVYAPTSGSYTRGALHWSDRAFLSEIDWVRLDFVRNDAWPLSERLVLATGLRSGAVIPYGPDDGVPLQERYFNGGEGTVRSFRESELGPKDSQGDPLGGEAWNAASVEARWRVAGRFETALFVDAGNVVQTMDDWGRFDGWSFGVGLGLRYMLPVGPVRLDGALNPDPREGDSDGAVHLTVGLSF